jgi:hypothetical protein
VSRIAAVYVMEDAAGRRKVGHSKDPLRRSADVLDRDVPTKVLHISDYSSEAAKIENTARRLLKLAGKHLADKQAEAKQEGRKQ